MVRRARAPTTALGVEIRRRRGELRHEDLVDSLGIARTTIGRVERGVHTPSLATARALAKWLDWSLEEVLAAAERPPDKPNG